MGIKGTVQHHCTERYFNKWSKCDGGLEQGVSDGDCENSLASGYVLKIKSRGFADGIVCVRQRRIKGNSEVSD